MSGYRTELGDAISGIGDAISGAINYWQDPWGNTFKALKDSAKGLANDVLPQLTEATLPDFSSDWFISAYQISFATSIFIAVVILILQTVRTAQGTLAGRDLIQSFALYFPGFLIGGMFGPAAGILLVSFFHSLSDVFVKWGITGSIDQTVDSFQKMLDDADPVGITGGVVIAVILMLLMIIGLIMVLLVLLVQLVALYFTGALFTLGYVWMIDPKTRDFAAKMGRIFLGILASHPLLFLLLGLTFNMMAGSTSAFGNNASLKSMVELVVAFIALMMAALSPLILMKFAPVLPMGGGGGSGPALSSSMVGSPSVSDAVKKYGSRSSGDSASSAGSAESVSTQGSTPTLAEAAGSGGGGAAGGGAASFGARAAGPVVSGAAPAAAGGAGVAAAVGGEGAVAVGATGMAAAGVAETSTGVGAAVGVPTIIAAVGLAAAGAAAVKTVELTEQAGAMATEAMDDPPIGQDGLA